MLKTIDTRIKKSAEMVPGMDSQRIQPDEPGECVPKSKAE